MKPVFYLFLIVLIFFSCQKNDEESEFLRFGNKRKLMYGDWVIDKVYGNGQDLTDSFLTNMPNLKLKFTDSKDYYDNYLFQLFIDNKVLNGHYIIKQVYPENAFIVTYNFGTYLSYGTKRMLLPVLEQIQLDSMANGDTIVFDYFNSIYTNKYIEQNMIKLSCYSNKYQEIILKKL